MTECFTCRKATRIESSIKCMGVCEKYFHATERCAGLDSYSLNILNTSKRYIKFLCDDCMQHILDVDFVLKDVQDQVNKSNRMLSEYKDEFDKLLKKNEEELKCLLQVMEAKFSERIDSMKKAQKVCTDSVVEIREFYNISETIAKKNVDICKNLESSKDTNDKILKEINESVKKISTTTPVSYADALKVQNSNVVSKNEK